MIVNTHISLGHLNVRTGPGFNYPVIFTLDENQAIMTTSEPGGWIAVETMDGRRGYANSAFLINPPEN
jgi:uncharacterized protein YraI